MSKQTVIPKQPGSHYTDEQRRAVIADLVVIGNMTKTAKLHNMPKQTVSEWAKSDWGVELLGQIRTEKGEELDANLTKLMDSAFDEAQDRIDNGDYRVTKDGKLIRVPMGGKELVISGATVYDKRQLHRNLPTNISGSQSTEKQLQAVLDKCAAINNTLNEKRVNSIDGEYSEVVAEVVAEVADQSAKSDTKKGKSKKVSKDAQ